MKKSDALLDISEEVWAKCHIKLLSKFNELACKKIKGYPVITKYRFNEAGGGKPGSSTTHNLSLFPDGICTLSDEYVFDKDTCNHSEGVGVYYLIGNSIEVSYLTYHASSIFKKDEYLDSDEVQYQIFYIVGPDKIRRGEKGVKLAKTKSSK